LPDINVWVALASDRHVHHDRAKAWFEGVEANSAAFCRVTQMGFLRLITNPHVMGEDVVKQKQAWEIYAALSRDSRIYFAEESAGLEDEWRRISHTASGSSGTWTDTYLAAFASIRGIKVVSFDNGFKKLIGNAATIL
jgi:uncharacterized protein